MFVADLLGDKGTIFIFLNFFCFSRVLSKQMPENMRLIKDFLIQKIQSIFNSVYAKIPRANKEN